MKNKKKLIIIISIAIILIIGIAISIILLTQKETNTNENNNQSQEVQNDTNNDNEDNNTINDEENKDEVKKQTTDEKLEQKDNKESGSTSNKEQKSNNTNSKSNSNTKSNNSNSSNTQTNTTNNTSNSNSNQLIPVGTTYTYNGTKVTILDNNKARLEYNGGTWITDVVDRTGAGVQYNINFKHKAGSGSPKYYYQSSILFPMSMSVMSNNINSDGGVYISDVSSNLGSVVNKMYVGKANGYSCIPNLNSLNAGGSDGCLSWVSTVKGDSTNPDYDYTTYYVFNDKMEVLGYVFLEARLKPENEWVGTGDPHVNPENWNVKQLYK